MKFTLNESNRFFLDERFVLNEADAPIALVPVDTINVLYKRLQRIARKDKRSDTDKSNEDTIAKLQERIFLLAHTADGIKDTEMLKGKVKEAIADTEKIFSLADPSFDRAILNSVVKDKSGVVIPVWNDIRNLATSSDTSRKTYAELKNKLKLLSSSLSKFNFATMDAATANANQIKAIESALVSLNQLKEFIRDRRTLDEDTKKLINDSFTNCVIAENAYREPGEDVEEKLNELVKACEAFSKTISSSLSDAGFSPTAKLTDRINWDDRYKNTTDKASFWKSYYEEAWGGDAKRVLALGEVFRKQCLSLGFTEATNPFIAFLRKYLVKKGYIIPEAVYIALHNAVASGQGISLNKLNSSANKTNLAACKDLYGKSGKEAAEYFKLFGEIVASGLDDKIRNKDTIAASIADAAQKRRFNAIASHFDSTRAGNEQFIWAILYNSIPLSKLLSSGTQIALPAADAVETAKLRPIAEIEAILNALKPDRTTAKPFEATTLRSLLGKIPDDVDKAAQWVRVMVMSFLLPGEAEDVYSHYAKVKDAPIPTGDVELRIKNEIFGLGNSMSKSDIVNVIKSLAARTPPIDLK